MLCCLLSDFDYYDLQFKMRIGATRKTGGSNRGYKPLTLTRA